MALTPNEEEKKRKLQTMNDVTSDTFSNFVNSTEEAPVPSTGKLVGGTVRGLKDIASAGTSIIGDSFKKVGSDIVSGYRKENPVTTDTRDTMPGKLQFNAGTSVPDIKVPTLKEIPNAQRDAELGKMTVSSNGDKVTYAIGGNTLSFNNREKQIRNNLALIDKKIASGITVSPEQMKRINAIREQSGLRSLGTSNDVNRVGNMDVQFDSSVTPEERKAFLTDPVRPTAQIDRYNERKLAQLQTNNVINDPMPIMPTNKTNAAMANYNKAMGEWSDRQIARDSQDINRDTNRINEMNVISENKYRDIQGQVAQVPPVKEKNPIVIDEQEPNPMNPAETIKKQRVIIKNPNGDGFIDVTPKQQAPSTTMPNVTPEQRSKINALIKANPNISKEVILQKIANGEI